MGEMTRSRLIEEVGRECVGENLAAIEGPREAVGAFVLEEVLEDLIHLSISLLD